MNIDFYPRVPRGPSSPLYDSPPLSPLSNFQDNNYDFSAYFQRFPATGPLYSPVNIDFYTHDQPTSPFVDRSLSPLRYFQDNNYDFSARGGHSIRTTKARISLDHKDLTFGEILSNWFKDLWSTRQDLEEGDGYLNLSFDEDFEDCVRLRNRAIIKLPKNQICNSPLEVASGKVLEETISVETNKFSGHNKLDSNHESPQGPQDYPNGGDMVQIDSSEQQLTVERKNAKKISKRSLICNAPLEVTYGKVLEEEIYVETTKIFGDNKLDSNHESPQGPQDYPNGGDMVQIDSSEQQLAVERKNAKKISKRSLICNAPLEVASGKVLEEAISVETTKFSGDNKLDSNHESPQGPQDYPNGGDIVQIDSSEQQPEVERKNAKKISKRSLICNAPLEVASGKVLEEAISVETTKFFGDNKLDSNHESPQGPQDYPNGGDMVQIDSSEQQLAVERKNAKKISKRSLICDAPLEVASGKVLEEEISVETTKIFGDNKLDSNHESPQGPQDYPNGGDMVQIDSSEQQLAVERKNPKKISKRSLICNAPLEVASGKVLEVAISVETTKFSGDNKLDSNHESPQGPQDYPNGGDMVQIDSFEQQLAVEFDVRHNEGNIVIMGESDTRVAGSERKNTKKISKRKHRKIETLITPEQLQQLKGRMTLGEIKERYGVGRSSVKRFCRKHKITTRWPRKRNESVQGVEGAVSQPCLTKDLLNDAIRRPAKLNRSNQQNLPLAFGRTELSPSAPYCVSNNLASTQPQISAERMLTEVPGCPEYLKFLHHSKKGKGVLESNETVRSCSNPSPEHTVAYVAPTMPQVIAMQDVSTMMIKVRYRSDFLRFSLSFSSGKRELEENISKRLGTFRIKYQDADGDWISITCDEDL